MPAKRRIRWQSDDSKEMGRNVGSDDEVSGQSGEDAIPADPKEMPLKRAEEGSPPSPEDVAVSPARSARRGRVGLRVKKPPPASQSQEEDADAAGDSGDASPEDAGAPGSVEVSPARSGPVGLKTKTKRVKKPPPASQSPEEDADAAGDSGDASPEDAVAPGSVEVSPAGRGRVGLKTKTKRVKKPRPASQSQEEDAAEDSGDASPARANDTADNKTRKRSRPPPQQGEERPEKRAAGPDGAAASAPRRKKKSKRSDEKKDRRKKRKNKKKKLRKALAKLTPSPSPPESPGIASSPDIAQEDRVMTVQEQSNTSPPQDEHRDREEEQQAKKIAQQEHGAEEQPEMEDEETRIQVNGKALQGGKKAPSTKPNSSETEKKPSAERLWSYNDELKILNALASHAKSHDGALPESSDLLANFTFDKIDANEDKLSDKIRKLRARYVRLHSSQGCPPDAHGRQLYKLSAIIWGKDHELVQIEPTSRDLSVLSELYPYLFKEVSMYAETHSTGALIMAKFKTIGDEKARDLDAKCKKQQTEAFKLAQSQASLTNTLLSAL